MTDAAIDSTPQPPLTVVVNKRMVEAYEIRQGHEWVWFAVSDEPRNHSLVIQGSYGNFVYTWSDPGVPFREFLAQLDSYYATKKLAGTDRELDGPAILKAIKEALLTMRKEGYITRDRARDEWDLLPVEIEGDGDFHRWLDHTELVDAHEYAVMKPGPQMRDFMRMYQMFWPAFAEKLRSLHNGG